MCVVYLSINPCIMNSLTFHRLILRFAGSKALYFHLFFCVPIPIFFTRRCSMYDNFQVYQVFLFPLGVCRLRLDFESFTLLGTGNTEEFVDENTVGGVCMDTFTISVRPFFNIVSGNVKEEG